MGDTTHLYRESKLGDSLVEALDILVDEGKIPGQLALRILAEVRHNPGLERLQALRALPTRQPLPQGQLAGAARTGGRPASPARTIHMSPARRRPPPRPSHTLVHRPPCRSSTMPW